jgi:hypothetical protein
MMFLSSHDGYMESKVTLVQLYGTANPLDARPEPLES